MDFLELPQVLSTYDGDLRDPLWWPQERPVPMRVARGPLGIPLPSMPGLRPFVESLPEREDFTPVLTWSLGDFWSLPRGISARLEWGHARALSSRAVAACHASLCLDQGICVFPSSFPTRVSHETFPQGCPMGHRGVSRSSA